MYYLYSIIPIYIHIKQNYQKNIKNCCKNKTVWYYCIINGFILERKEMQMGNSNDENQTLYITPERIMLDWGVSKSKAYNLIAKMNDEIKKENPDAITLPGKLNKKWYEKACLQNVKL